MAKPRQANGRNSERRRIVARGRRACCYAGSRPVFSWEGWCRCTIRSALCLQGNPWPVSDRTAAEIVRQALDLLDAERPPWLWGQIEFTWEAGTRIEHTHCLQCGTRLPEDRLKFCSKACGSPFPICRGRASAARP